jgi:hypothetical protein
MHATATPSAEAKAIRYVDASWVGSPSARRRGELPEVVGAGGGDDPGAAALGADELAVVGAQT